MEKSRFDIISDLFKLSNAISDNLKLAESLAGRTSADDETDYKDTCRKIKYGLKPLPLLLDGIRKYIARHEDKGLARKFAGLHDDTKRLHDICSKHADLSKAAFRTAVAYLSIEVIGQYFFPEKELAEVSPGMPDNIPKPMTRTEATDCIDIIHTTIRKWAEDIEEIKKKLDAKDSQDKDEALKELAVKLEPVISFFNGNAPGNVSAIFGSKEAIKEYQQSIGDEAVASLRLYLNASNKDMREHGVLTVKGQLDKILEMLTSYMERDRRASEKSQQKPEATSKLWQVIRLNKATNAIRRLWSKVPDGWHKNPYAWAGICCTLVFFALFIISWVQWYDYQEENRQLRTVADKHKVTTVMLNELHPGLAVTIGVYEKLTETVGADSTLTVFWEQVKTVRKESKNRSK